MSAREALIGALDAAYRAGTPAPCAPTPDAAGAAEWDDIPHSGGQKTRAIKTRKAACRTCPVFTECDDLRRDELARGMEPYGVMAGRLHGLAEAGSGRPAKKYTPEEKQAAVALYVGGMSAATVAATVGINETTAHEWIRAAGVTRTHAESQRIRRAQEATGDARGDGKEA